MSVVLALPKEYGYVIAAGVVSIIVSVSLGVKVGRARKEAQVPYPYMYATAAEVEKDPKKHKFNCVQRGHQNMMEIYPQFLFTLLIAGVKFPLPAAAFGLIWSAGRYLYATGYATGDPSKRGWGSIGYIGTLGLLGSTLLTAFQLVTA